MTWMVRNLLLSALLVAGCKHAEPAVATPAPVPALQACDTRQAAISKEADQRAHPWSIKQHLAKNFPNMKVSWLMPEGLYQKYVVQPGAKNFGRCDDTGCYLFAAPAAVIRTPCGSR
jgi:hypothetical protein